MFDHSHYILDSNYPEATLKAGACLYRITKAAYADPQVILNGMGPLASRCTGRFNRVQQPTTYCGNNVLAVLAESLFHRYRTVVDAVRDRRHPREIRDNVSVSRVLVVTCVSPIGNIVYVDAKDFCLVMNDSRFCGTMLVLPDDEYSPFHEMSDRLRADRKKGIAYPSARHTEGICYAFFEDETQSVQANTFRALEIELQLIEEMQDLSQPPSPFDPLQEKIHPTMGHFRFTDSNAYASVQACGCMNPQGLPISGYVEFARRRYNHYPADAVIPT